MVRVGTRCDFLVSPDCVDIQLLWPTASAAAQEGQVLGNIGLLDGKTRLNDAGEELTFPQHFHDGNPGRMAQRLNDAGSYDRKRLLIKY